MQYQPDMPAFVGAQLDKVITGAQRAELTLSLAELPLVRTSESLGEIQARIRHRRY